jgi:large subunit ribosomal protein L10
MATFAHVAGRFLYLWARPCRLQVVITAWPRKDERVAITRQRKEELLSLYTEIIQHADGFVLAEYNRLSTPKINTLRANLRKINGKFVITKNTLFTKALKDAGWPVPTELLKGSVAVAYGQGNFPQIAKEILAFMGDKENTELLKNKGGVMIASILRAQDVETISSLPSLDELRAQLAGLIVQPAASLVGIIDSATGQLVNVLQAYVTDRGAA